MRLGDGGMMREFEVKDGNRTIRFSGRLLASVSSKRAYTGRWVDLELYRLPDSSFERAKRDPDGPVGIQNSRPGPTHVFSRIGRSSVYHSDDCPDIQHKLPYGHELASFQRPDVTDLMGCRMCSPSVRPDDAADWSSLVSRPDFLTSHRFEVPRFFAAVVQSPKELMVMLADNKPSRPEAPGALVKLPWLSHQLLDEASLHDEMLASEYVLDLRDTAVGV